MYKVILFDADNTLFDYDRAEDYALKSSLDHFGFSGDSSSVHAIYRRINSGLWRELEEGRIGKDQLRTKRFARLFSHFDLDLPIPDFSGFYLDRLAEGAFLLDGALELCQALHPNYRMMIVTNGIREIQVSRLERSPIKEFMEAIVTSEELGVNKPHPRIFEHSLELLGHVKKDDVLMVGDSLSSDIQGGNNFGIATCWFNPKGLLKDSEIEPTYQISKLEDLHGILR